MTIRIACLGIDADSDRERRISRFQDLPAPKTPQSNNVSSSSGKAVPKCGTAFLDYFVMCLLVPNEVYADSERMLAGPSRAAGIFAEARRITSSSAGANSSGGIPPTAT
jgi:hypothetical protein